MILKMWLWSIRAMISVVNNCHFRVVSISIFSLFWGFYQQSSFSSLLLTIPVFSFSSKLKLNFDWTNILIQGGRKFPTVYQDSHMSQSGHFPQGSQRIIKTHLPTYFKHQGTTVIPTLVNGSRVSWSLSQMKCRYASNNRKAFIKYFQKQSSIFINDDHVDFISGMQG